LTAILRGSNAGPREDGSRFAGARWRCLVAALSWRGRLPGVGAENGVTAADLVFAAVRWVTELGIWVREHGKLRHCQYSLSLRLAYLGVLRVFGWLAQLACYDGRKMTRSSPVPPGRRAPEGTEAVLDVGLDGST
jgi:hypothetical protein